MAKLETGKLNIHTYAKEYDPSGPGTIRKSAMLPVIDPELPGRIEVTRSQPLSGVTQLGRVPYKGVFCTILGNPYRSDEFFGDTEIPLMEKRFFTIRGAVRAARRFVESEKPNLIAQREALLQAAKAERLQSSQ